VEVSSLSKYDDYWKRMLPQIQELLREALLHGKSQEIELSGLKNLGDRQHWYGRVDILVSYTQIDIETDGMAHANSLAKIFEKSNAFSKLGRSILRLRISNKPTLRAELFENDSTIPSKQESILEKSKAAPDSSREKTGPTEKRKENLPINENESYTYFSKKMNELMYREFTGFSKAPHEIPKDPGVYLIFDKRVGKNIYVGRSGNLRRRLLQNHRQGNVEGSQFRKALSQYFKLDSESKITNYILDNCSYKYLALRNFEEMVRLEHFVTAIIGPVLNVKLKQ
jgi:very-short-patch-repair endonuclease